MGIPGAKVRFWWWKFYFLEDLNVQTHMGEDTLLPRTAAGSSEWSSQGRQEAKAATATVPADAHNSGSPLMHLVLCNSLFR